jgi:hypothetical protein
MTCERRIWRLRYYTGSGVWWRSTETGPGVWPKPSLRLLTRIRIEDTAAHSKLSILSHFYAEVTTTMHSLALLTTDGMACRASLFKDGQPMSTATR